MPLKYIYLKPWDINTGPYCKLLETNFNCLIQKQKFSVTKIHLKMVTIKSRPIYRLQQVFNDTSEYSKRIL